MRVLWPAILCLSAFVLTACDEEVEEPEGELIRSIKYMSLDQRAGLQDRRIAGIVAAAQTTNIAFETNGQVIELLRKPGDSVEAGALVARLDPEPYQLQVDQAQNTLDQALATLDDAQKKFDQQSKLLQQGFATKTAFDSAEAALKNAKGAVGVAESQLDLARRNLSKTDLRAPFDGVVARQLIDVYEEVSGGQAIYDIQSVGEGKVEASLPETLINTVSLGTTVAITFPPLGGAQVQGSIDEIAPLTGDANAYPIEIVLARTPPGLRSGMSAEVTFSFASEETGKAFVVPLTAVQPNPGQEEAHVYVFDKTTKTLAKRDVRVVNVKDNSLEIIGDLQQGEIIATAGISFLHDGMRVDLFDPEALR